MSPLMPRRAISISLAAGLIGGALVGFSFADQEKLFEKSAGAVAAAENRRAPLPAGSDVRGLVGVERTAVDLAFALDAVPVRADGDDATRFCGPGDLRVRWTAPAPGEFVLGGHVDPVGPAPTQETDEVNGLVVCEGVSYAYMGFEARWDGRSWTLSAVPALSDEHDLEHEGEEHEGEEHEEAAHPEDGHEPRAHGHAHEKPAAPAARTQPTRPAAAARGFHVPPVNGIDGYAAYDPQRVCDPAAKPGAVALRDLLLRTYPGSRSLGVSRTCSARGTSEHKEGRAFDWGVNKSVPSERAAAEHAIAQLLATDSAGHRHALARRLGVMYLIWDRQIWSAYSSTRGWRPYSGANAHTDHVHISLSWDGAMGRTSYWSGANATLLTADPGLELAPGSPPIGGSGGTSPAGGSGSGAKAARSSREVKRTSAPSWSDDTRSDGDSSESRDHDRDPAEQERWELARALRHQEQAERHDEHREWLAQRAQERAQRREQRQREREERKAARHGEGSDGDLAITSLAVVAVAPTDVQSAAPRPEPATASKPVTAQAAKAPKPVKQAKPVKAKVAKAPKAQPVKASKPARAKAKPVKAKVAKAPKAKPAKAQKAPKERGGKGGGKGRG